MADLFTFQGASVPESAHVVGFHGHEAISELCRFEIGLLLKGEEEIVLADAIGTAATLQVERGDGGDPIKYHGIIAQGELVHCWEGQSRYRVLLVPVLWQLGLSLHSRVFVDKAVPDIASDTLTANDVSQHELKLMGWRPAR